MPTESYASVEEHRAALDPLIRVEHEAGPPRCFLLTLTETTCYDPDGEAA